MAVCLAAGLWGAAGALGGVAGYECKNGSSDWPLPCRDPSEAIASYQLGRPGQPASEAFPISVGELDDAVVRGTLTRSLELGRAVMAARSRLEDAVAAAATAGQGAVLFQGVVSDREWEDTPEGYMEGTTTLDGSGSDHGSTARIWFQNEHHLMWRDETAVAMSPDILAVVHTTSADPISNTRLDVGQEVSVLGFRSPDVFRFGAPLKATAPRHYGFDLDWVPIEELNPDHVWG